MLDTQTRMEYAPARRTRCDQSPKRRPAPSPAGADAPLEILFEAEAPPTARQDDVGPIRSPGIQEGVPDGVPEGLSHGIPHADRSSLGAYLQEVRRHPLMTREAEHELAVQFQATGDPRLAARLVNANLRLVIKIAKEYRRAHSQLSDLVQEGNVGLLHAVAKYDPSLGVKLSSYASWWIRAYMLKFVMSNYRLVKLGTTQPQRRLFFNLRKEREKLERQGLEVSAKQLAAALDVTEEEVVEMSRRLDAGDASLDAPPRGDRDHTLRDIVAAPESRPDVNVELGELKTVLGEKLRAFAATLKGRDLAIFNDRLCNEEPAQLSQLGVRFGISRERVRQLENRLKERIRHYLRNEIDDVEAIAVAQ